MPLDLGGQLVILLDMAGLRETESKAEAEGVRRAHAEIAQADLVLWLVAPDIADIAKTGLGRAGVADWDEGRSRGRSLEP